MTPVEKDKLKRFLRQPDAALLYQAVDEKLQYEFRALKTGRELIDIGRAQGQVDVLEWLLKLRKDD